MILEEKLHFENPSDDSRPGQSHHPRPRNSEEYKFSDLIGGNISEGEPFISVNPNNPDHLIVGYMEIGLELTFPIYYTLDGGKSWLASSFDTRATFKEDFPELLLAGGGDPVFAFDNNGRIYFSWIYLGQDGTIGKIFTFWAWSDDMGQSFQMSEGENSIIEKGGFDFFNAELQDFGEGILDRPWLAVDQSHGEGEGTLYCAALFVPKDSTALDGNGVILRIKKPGIDSFERKHLAVGLHENTQFSNVAVDDKGIIHMSFVDLDSGQLIYARSDNYGESVTAYHEVAEITSNGPGADPKIHSRENPSPSLVASLNGEQIAISWSDFSSDTVRGYVSYSKDAGSSWSDGMDISSLAPPGIIQSLMPTVTKNSSGDFAIGWMGLNENDSGRYYSALSENGGETFSSATITSKDTTDFGFYKPDPFIFFGDYSNAQFVGDMMHVVWSDGRLAQGAKVYYTAVDPGEGSVGFKSISPITDQIQIGSLYPVPGGDQVFLDIQSEFRAQTQLEIYTVTGIRMKVISISLSVGDQTIELDIEKNWPHGMYYVRISTKEGYFTRSFIIQ